MKYIIVQAGGKGTRLEHLTKNKPKALVPVDNLPMLFHLFRMYPDKRFIIIADYKRDVMRKYLNAFADVKYRLIDAKGTKTASGIQQAVEFIPENEPFMLVWSDLILPSTLELPVDYAADDGVPTEDYIGISTTFPCRWKYENGVFKEERSTEHGVAGFFLFQNKKSLSGVPESGALVAWMHSQNKQFKELSLAGCREYGLLSEYEALPKTKCRPFNRITINGDILIKEPIDAQGEMLAIDECAWYDKVHTLNLHILPKIYSTNPLKMEFIQGKNIYDCKLDLAEQKKSLTTLISALKSLHQSDSAPCDYFSMHEAYFHKTVVRLSKIRGMIPFADERSIRINGRDCRNVYFYLDELEKRLESLRCNQFHLIHGDCTFSNIMLRDSGEPILIDPRGYFGFTKLYGDPRYDWAKLYYSVVGNYDRFNLKDFRLDISKHEIKLSIASNGWESMEKTFFDLTGADRDEIQLLHAVIWLSLTTYAWQDYDSVCGAFYNGLWYLEEVL